jgi:CelD/BcsL family acetyltransferase involved in cellulose biosynthesis
MNVALRHPPSHNRAQPATDGRIARIAVFDDLSAAEPFWRALEHQDILAAPYQRYDFLSLWQRHVGQAAGVEPFVVVGFDAAGASLFVWPFGRRKIGRFRVVEFLGGKHSNFNLALWRRDLAATITESEIRGVVAELARRDVDALVLLNQSLTWQGTTNPFALLPQQPSPDFAYSGALTSDFEALLRARTSAAVRKKMRKKERTLAGYGAVRFKRVSELAEARRVLDAFFKQKAARMRALGVSDVFAAPGVRRFIEAAATHRLAQGSPAIELYALWVDDIVVATMGGIVGGERFCAMLNSIIHDRFGAESPGEQLILHLVRSCCERNLSAFDLGIGEAGYKTLFCPDAEPLFDSFLPFTPAGRAIALTAQLARRAKRAIKRNPLLWSALVTGRRLRARLTFAA